MKAPQRPERGAGVLVLSQIIFGVNDLDAATARFRNLGFDVLDGGVNDSLNLDMHGKALSFHLLAITVQVPIATHLSTTKETA